MKKLIALFHSFFSFAEKYPSLSFLLLTLAVVALIVYVAVFFVDAETIIFTMYFALALSSLLIVGLTLMVFLHVVRRIKS